MPAKNHLTFEQKQKLQTALKQETNGEIRERILILLLRWGMEKRRKILQHFWDVRQGERI